MRDIILISAICELVLVACAIVAGAPVVALLRAGTKRAANAAALCALAVACWVTAGLAVNGVVARLPDEGRFGAGLVRLGDFEFNLIVLAPMLLVTLLLAYGLAFSLVAAAIGRGLPECARAALNGAARLRSPAARPARLSEL